LRTVLVLLALVGTAGGGWYAYAHSRSATGKERPSAEAGTHTPVAVEVVYPRAGGIDRVCVQPGTVEPFQAADLYAKASGFLVEQVVDIGSRVKKGDVLARVSVPEYEKQVQRDKARVKSAEAKVRQMQAHVTAAESEAKAADASVKRAKAMVLAKAAYRKYRGKQLARFSELAAKQAIEPQVVDEQEDFFLSAQEAENEAKEAVNAATERAAAARAKIEQAKADLEEIQSEVAVATAELERSQVLLEYTAVKSPYTGVVTRRTFHVGDFIRSADQGGAQPLLSVERTDVMRAVIQVPDRDEPYVSLGDPVTIEIDALPERGAIPTKGVARWAKAEDLATRTMRVEADVVNPTDEEHPDGLLATGMYGRAAITLTKGRPAAVRIPTTALTSRPALGKGTVRVVRGQRIQTVSVALGADNGVEVEALAGLTPADQVVVRTSGPAEDGAPVVVGGASPAASGH
jgi:RND family efflux transporter MFP subunit